MITVVFVLISTSGRPLFTAFITSLSLPTPEGSTIIRSGLNCSATSFKAFAKSPTRLQQIQPLFISVICTPVSCKNPPSIPISPNSFSIITFFSLGYASRRSFLIRVVLPAPKKPDIISIFIFLSPLFRFSISISVLGFIIEFSCSFFILSFISSTVITSFSGIFDLNNFFNQFVSFIQKILPLAEAKINQITPTNKQKSE